MRQTDRLTVGRNVTLTLIVSRLKSLKKKVEDKFSVTPAAAL
jgi:hypothetical protein